MERRYAWNRIEDERETTRAPFRFDSRARPVCAKISTHLRSPITIYRVKITRITGGEKSNGRNEICICMEDLFTRHRVRVIFFAYAWKLTKTAPMLHRSRILTSFLTTRFVFRFSPSLWVDRRRAFSRKSTVEKIFKRIGGRFCVRVSLLVTRQL